MFEINGKVDGKTYRLRIDKYDTYSHLNLVVKERVHTELNITVVRKKITQKNFLGWEYIFNARNSLLHVYGIAKTNIELVLMPIFEKSKEQIEETINEHGARYLIDEIEQQLLTTLKHALRCG